MFIRGTRVQTPPEKVDDAIANFKKQVIPNASKAPGYLGAALLVDRQSGAGIGITYWESAKALSKSEQMGIKTRTDATQNVPGTRIVNVERYEIVIMERMAPPKADTFIRVNVLNADPDKVDALTVFTFRRGGHPPLPAKRRFSSTIARQARTASPPLSRPSGEARVSAWASFSTVRMPYPMAIPSRTAKSWSPRALSAQMWS